MCKFVWPGNKSTNFYPAQLESFSLFGKNLLFFKGFACTLWSIFRVLLCLLNRLNILACNWLLDNAFGLSKFNWLGCDGYTIVNPYGGHSLAGWLTIWHFGRISIRFFLEAFLGLLFAQTFWFMSSQDEGCWLAYRHTKIEILQKTFRAANNRKTKKKERKEINDEEKKTHCIVASPSGNDNAGGHKTLHACIHIHTSNCG